MVMQKTSERTKAVLKKRNGKLMEKKSVKYADEPKMTSVNPAKEPKNKPKYK